MLFSLALIIIVFVPSSWAMPSTLNENLRQPSYAGDKIVSDIGNDMQHSTLESIELIGSLEGGSCRKLEIHENLAYCCYGSCLIVLDISDANQPEKIGMVQLPCYVNDVAVSGDYAYVATDFAGMIIIDINDPNELD
jgi:hypothetical protein